MTHGVYHSIHTIGFDPPHCHPGVLHFFVNCRGLHIHLSYSKEFQWRHSFLWKHQSWGWEVLGFSYRTRRRTMRSRRKRRRSSSVSPPYSHIKVRHLFSLGLVFTCIWVLDVTRKTKLSPSKAGPRKWPFDVFTFGVPCGMWVLPPLSDLVELLVRPQCSSGSYCEWMNCSREHWLTP